MFLKNKNIIFKIRRSKVTDYAALIIQEGLLSVTSESMCTKSWLTACSSLPRKKSVVRWTDRPAMTIAVDLGRKATKQTKNICLVKQLQKTPSISKGVLQEKLPVRTLFWHSCYFPYTAKCLREDATFLSVNWFTFLSVNWFTVLYLSNRCENMNSGLATLWFSGDPDQFVKKPNDIFVIFQGGGVRTLCPPSGSAHD